MPLTRRSCRLALVGLCATLACGAPPAGSKDPGTSDDVPPADVPVDGADGTDAFLAPTEVDEDFRLLLTRVGALDPNRNALVLLDPRLREWQEDSAPFVITSSQTQGTASPSPANPGLDCRLGCFADASMTWLAVQQEIPDTFGNTQLVVGRLDQEWVFRPLDDEPIPDVTALAFAGPWLVYSQRILKCEADTGPPQTCWMFRRLNLESPSEVEDLFQFPTSRNLHLSGHAGQFTVSGDGSTLVVQDPRPGTLTLWAWRQEDDRGVRQVGEPICGERLDRNEQCPQVPGRFTDREPLALSMDGDVAVLAVIEHDLALRLLALDLDQANPALTRTDLSRVPTSDETTFRADACFNPQTAWWTRVHPSMRIAGSGPERELVFVAERKCGRTQKPSTQIVAAPVAQLLDDPKVPRTIRRVTNFPEGDVPANVVIPDGGFDLSPSGTLVAFLGTPILNSEGVPLQDSDQGQQYNDVEVHVTRLDGTTRPVQVSADQDTRSWSLKSVVGGRPIPRD